MVMDEKNIAAKVNAALCDEFELDEAKMLPEASIRNDLGLDSLDIVDMVIVLEKAFGVKLKKKEDLVKIQTLGDIHAYIARLQDEYAGQTAGN